MCLPVKDVPVPFSVADNRCPTALNHQMRACSLADIRPKPQQCAASWEEAGRLSRVSLLAGDTNWLESVESGVRLEDVVSLNQHGDSCHINNPTTAEHSQAFWPMEENQARIKRLDRKNLFAQRQQEGSGLVIRKERVTSASSQKIFKKKQRIYSDSFLHYGNDSSST